MKEWYRCSLDGAVGTEEPYIDVLDVDHSSAAANYLQDLGHDVSEESVVTVTLIDDSGKPTGSIKRMTMRARVVWDCVKEVP